MKIERIILVFKKTEETVFKEINADDLDFSLLETLFVPFADDPNIYRPYEIGQTQYNELIKYKSELISYPITEFDLFIEAVTV